MTRRISLLLRLQEASLGRQAAENGGRAGASGNLVATTFHALQHIERAIVADGDAVHALELVLADGRTLRVAPGFDAATLRRLLAVLREDRPC